MIDTIHLPTEDFKRERIEIHLEFQKQVAYRPKPIVPYVYGIINNVNTNDFNGSARLVTGK
ncbi:MAG: hypothetical protein FJY20_00355 [Bacteroidetes bacterium]|nr:hypothetical protein [Bacteroidota bacterium]